jgi:hypothetical protein
MSNSSTRTTRRWAGALGTTGLLALALAAPAAARPDPGTGGLHERLNSTQLHQNDTGPVPGGQVPGTTSADGTAYLELGAGVLAGLALAGAGAVVVSRRRHSHGHPQAA